MTIKPREKGPSNKELTEAFFTKLETYEGVIPEVMRENASTIDVRERVERESWTDWARRTGLTALLP